MTDCACHGCAARHVGCHAECAEYAEFKRKRDAAKDKKRGDGDVCALLSENYITRQRRSNLKNIKYKAFGGGSRG